MTASWILDHGWQPLTPPRTNGLGLRSGPTYSAIIDQFEVETAPRYAPGQGVTFCNIFALDVTAAMGTGLGHWYDPGTGDPTAMGIGQEMSANRLNDWLHKFGAAHGWNQISQALAATAAFNGYPTLASWRNVDGKPGHVAVVRPTNSLLMSIAQAGGHNFNQGTLSQGFGKLKPDFFTHR